MNLEALEAIEHEKKPQEKLQTPNGTKIPKKNINPKEKKNLLND